MARARVASTTIVLFVPIAMPSPLRINYLILDELDPNKIRYITIDSNQTVQDLQKAIASEHLLAAGQISKLERVTLSLVNDEEIKEKLLNFTFNPTANTWRAMTKLSAVIAPADLAPDHLHLIIRA